MKKEDDERANIYFELFAIVFMGMAALSTGDYGLLGITAIITFGFIGLRIYFQNI